jgi:hypothetical protein
VAIGPGARPWDLDPRAPVVDADTFMLVVELEMRQAIRLEYFVSLLVVHIDTGESAGGALAEVIRGQIRGTDVVSVTSPSSLHVLLVSTDLDNLPGIIGRIVAAVNGRADGRLALSIGGACFPTTARDRAELLEQAQQLSAEGRQSSAPAGHRYRLARSMR